VRNTATTCDHTLAVLQDAAQVLAQLQVQDAATQRNLAKISTAQDRRRGRQNLRAVQVSGWTTGVKDRC
jgi:hypothetical protein